MSRVEEAIQILHNPYIEISTNLALATPKRVDEMLSLFKRNGWRGRIMVSHHGITKEKYESTMGLPWGKALKNLSHLISAASSNLSVWIHSASHSFDGKYIINNVDEIKYFWMAWFRDNNLPLRNIQIYPITFHNRAGNVQLDGWTPENPSLDYSGCPRIYDLHVLWNGEVVSCCCDYGHEMVLGDLSKQSITEYFNSSKYQDWTKQVQGEVEVPDNFICKRCTRVGA
jgi:hypothetical protein